MKIRSKLFFTLAAAIVTAGIILLPGAVMKDFEAYRAANGANSLLPLLTDMAGIAAIITFLCFFRYEVFGMTELDCKGVEQSLFGFKRLNMSWSEIKEIGVKKIKFQKGRCYCIYFSARHLKVGERSNLLLKRRSCDFIKLYVGFSYTKADILNYICKHYNGEVAMLDKITLR